MRRWVVLLGACTIAFAGCLNFDAARSPGNEQWSRYGLADEPGKLPANPVSPEQVQPDNAHQIAEALWDEIDREAVRK